LLYGGEDGGLEARVHGREGAERDGVQVDASVPLQRIAHVCQIQRVDSTTRLPSHMLSPYPQLRLRLCQCLRLVIIIIIIVVVVLSRLRHLCFVYTRCRCLCL
jgi:hypothetical protein